MDCSFAPSGRWFVFDTDTGETLEKGFGSKGGAVAWMGDVSAAMRRGLSLSEAAAEVRTAVAARREARRQDRGHDHRRDRRPPRQHRHAA